MRFFSLLIVSLSLILCLSACSNAKRTNGEKSEVVASNHEQADEKKPAINTSNKTPMDVDELQKKARYTFHLSKDKHSYIAFLYAEDETTERLSDPNFNGNEGDTIASGNYSLYLAEKGGHQAYKQDQIKPEFFNFNLSQNPSYTIKLGDRDIFYIVSPEASVILATAFYTIENGEIIKINGGDINYTFSSIVKVVDKNAVQTVQYNNAGEPEDFGWNFITVKLDTNDWTFKTIDRTIYNDDLLEDGLTYGKERYEAWANDKKNFIPYMDQTKEKPFRINKQVFDQFKKGRVAGAPYQIGDQISTVQEKMPFYIHKGYYEGGPYLKYRKYTFYYSEQTGKITAISLSYDQLNQDIDDVIQLLGSPSSDTFSDIIQMRSVYYTAGKYSMWLHVDEEGKIKEIFFVKK